MGVWETVLSGDTLRRSVALLLLAMSVASWVVILWKGWMLRRALADVQRSAAAFWQAADLDDAQRRLSGFDNKAAKRRPNLAFVTENRDTTGRVVVNVPEVVAVGAPV